MTINRRHWMAQAALGAWVLGRSLPVQAQGEGPAPKLVVILLRGALDGLHAVVPYGDPAYAAARPTLALRGPGQEGGVLALDRFFGLHPALAPLLPYWGRGELGFVHASGSPDPTRSHFDAQDYLETATPGRKSTPDGWMNRVLQAWPGPARPTRGVVMETTPPRIFSGAANVATLGLGDKALAGKAIDEALWQAKLGPLYEADPALAPLYRSATQGRQMLASDAAMAEQKRRGMDPGADGGAPSAGRFAQSAYRLGQIVGTDPYTQLAFTAVGGWDTHVNQGGATGQLASRLASLAEGLDALAKGLGEAWPRTAVVVMSEFGRTVRENGSRGTDHGHGNALWLLGGAIAGGQVLGEWPGLEAAALHEGRDLAITTDFRHVLAGLLTQHLRLDDRALAHALPALPTRTGAPLRLLRG